MTTEEEKLFNLQTGYGYYWTIKYYQALIKQKTKMTPKTVDEMIQQISELGVVTGYAGEEDIEPIFDFIKLVDDNGNRVDFKKYLSALLSQKDKERVEAYKRGYVQGGFDAEMNRLNTPPTN